MAIILPTQWTQQPQIPVGIAKGHPLAEKLAIVVTSNLAIARESTKPLVISAGSPSIAVGRLGIGPTFSGGTQRFDAGTAAISGATEGFTIEVLCSITAAPDLAGMFAGTYSGTPGSARGLISRVQIYYWGGGADWNTAVNWRTDGSVQHVFIVSEGGSGSAMRAYRDGVEIANTTTPTQIASTGQFLVGDTNQGWGATPTGTIAKSAFYTRALTGSEIAALTANPWQVFAPLPRRIFVQSGGASNDGTLARTNANDTSAASGSVTNTGTLARTNANDTSAGAGSQTNTGTLARTNANDSVSAAGDLGTFNGTVAYTNANDTSAASGSQTNTGTLARTNANDTSAASGTQTNTGTLARTNADDSVVANGSAGTVTGTVAYTNANDTLTATGGGGQSRGGIQRLKETKVKKSSTAVRDLLIETIDPQPAEIAELAEDMREAVLEPEEAEAAEPIVAQPVPEVEDKEKEARRVARRRNVMRLLLLDDMSIEFHAEKVMNEAEVKRQALIADVKASLRQAIARRRNANG
jgi:hypothetical protein